MHNNFFLLIISAIVSLILVNSCEKADFKNLWSKHEEVGSTKCFDIVHTANAPALVLQTILINKCTGETWITLREELPKSENQITSDSFYTWYKIHRSEYTNSIAGINKVR